VHFVFWKKFPHRLKPVPQISGEFVRITLPVEYNLPRIETEGGKMAEPTYDELKARLEELEKKGVRSSGELQFKVGEKGGVSVYGLGRFPVTLYYEQWNRLLEATPKLREFLEENKNRLKLKEK
jgi:hypothetical protein